MESITKLTAVLSWFNLVIASFLVLAGLVSGLAMGSMLYALTILVLAGAIILHSYAALQLKKSIVHPDIPLSHQTPVGIRFIGYAALFFAFIVMVNSITALQHIDQLVKQLSLPPDVPKVNLTGMLRGVSIFLIVYSLSIILNVFLNLRLLRWYQLQTSGTDQK